MMVCIDNRCADIYFNLAAEEYLLKRRREDYFMVWQSDPCVVMGKNQSVEAEVEAEYMRQEGIQLARRFSGGGTVYHDKGNINLTFIETVSQPVFDEYLQRTVDFLENMGLAAYTDERLGIYLDGKKISGSAQCIHKDRVMYHCTLLFSTNLTILNKVLQERERASEAELIPGLQAVRAVPSVRSEVTNICLYLDTAMDIKRFMRLLFHYFLTEDDGNTIYHFSPEDEATIGFLKREKYADEGWIWQRAAFADEEPSSRGSIKKG